MAETANTPSGGKELLEKFSAASTQRPPSRGFDCVNHPGIPGLYYCPNCRTWRCKTCSRTFETVAVCVECDCLALHASDLEKQSKEVIERARPYSWHLLRALTYPVRHFIFTLTACAVVWLTGAVTQALSEAAHFVPLNVILAGPMVEWSGTGVAFAVAGAIAMTRLIVRVNGQESLKWEQIGDFTVIGEPVAYWIASAFIGLAPLAIDLWFYKFRTLMVAIVVGIDARALEPKLTTGRLIGIWFFGLWALFFYPMSWVVAGVRKSVLPILNPLAAIAGWIGLRRWLVPALGIFFTFAAATAAVIYFFGDKRGGLLLYSTVMTVGNLVSAQAIAAAVCQGVDHADLEGTFKIRLPEFFDRFFR
ncbi:MAG TPA: hypothetical protein VFV34_01685 [Blastocatellia bacterium]|nr:hypothetical protein [Blastocatellia bacterium]